MKHSIIGSLAFILLVSLVCVGLFVLSPKIATQTDLNDKSLTFIQGNTLVGYYQVPLRVQVLGTKTGDTLECESQFRHHGTDGKLLVGDKHLPLQAYGIGQYQIRTFNWLKELVKMPTLNIENEDDQIILMQWAIENGYGNLWTCYRKLK